jgi:hypothetical protein
LRAGDAGLDARELQQLVGEARQPRYLALRARQVDVLRRGVLGAGRQL